MIDDPVSLPPLTARPSPSVDDAIRSRIKAGLAPARGPSRTTRWALGLVAVVATLVAVHLLTVGLGTVPSTPMVITCVVIIAVATFAGFGRAGTARVGVSARAVFALVPLGVFVTLFVAMAHGPFVALHGNLRAHVGCFAVGTLFALVPMGALMFLWRRTDPFTPRLSGAIIGGWAGLTGATGLAMSCLSTNATHILVGHGAAVLGGGLVGSFLGKRFLAP